MNARASIPSWFLFSSVLLASALTGCAQNPTNVPTSSRASASAMGSFLAVGGSGAYFPLQIGNRWRSESDFRSTLTTPEGVTDTYAIHANITSEIIGTETLAGRSYIVEQIETDEDGPFGPFNFWLRYRQDAAGLYEADVALNIPPVLDSGESVSPISAARPETPGLPAKFAERLPANQRGAYEAAWDVLQKRIAVIRSVQTLASGNGAAHPGGVLPDELTRLAYPLHPGATWVIRADPLFGSIVEANGNVVVPAGKFAASQIRITTDLLGPNDVVREWFSRAGQLAFRYHIESEATDVDGNPIGTLAADYDETLRDLSLVGH